MELVRPAYQGPEFYWAGILPDNVWDWRVANILTFWILEHQSSDLIQGLVTLGRQ